MKTTILTGLCSVALVLSAFGQDPNASATAAAPAPTVAQPASTFPPASPTIAPAVVRTSATPDDENSLQRKIEDKVRKHVQVSFGDDHSDRSRSHSSHDSDVDDSALMAIPIVGIIFTTLFGAPVLVVGLIMFFSYWKARSLHKTVRMMVEKGQEVPAALFSGPPPVVRARSDMRRGVVLMMVGIGLMVFFGAVNDWDGGAWALGIIPFLIGAGYLLVWKLEGNKPGTDNTARLS